MGFSRRRILAIAASILIGATALSATGADAALAPHYERVRQFNAVMSVMNEAAAKLASHGAIDRIERSDDGTFLFRAKGCAVPARLEVIPPKADQPPMPGTPVAYRVTLGEVRCD